MWVRPSTAFYGSFSLGMGRSPGFGPAPADSSPCSGSVSLRLRASGPLTSPARAARRTVLQKVRGPRLAPRPTACRHRVSGSLSLPSRGPFHLSFTVLCSIGHWVVFRLAGWSPLLPTGFLVPRGTLDPAAPSPLPCTGPSPSLAGFPKPIPLASRVAPRGPNPRAHAPWFGLLRFRSPLLTESMFLSLPPAT